MKMKKKTAMLLSFALGTTLFVTTAFAEVTTRSGYDQLKDAVKFASKSFSKTLSSYTADVSYSFKDNGVVIATANQIAKVDVEKGAQENVSISSNVTDSNFKDYSYMDKTTYVFLNSQEDTYYVSENGSFSVDFHDPFQEKGAADVEKIFDALVGNLKDYVVVTETTDGGKEITGTIKESQVPALINALASFTFKQRFSGTQYNMVQSQPFPMLTKDIFVKEATGKMSVDGNGLIQSVLATGILSGRDEKDVEHNLSLEVLVKILDVNNTVVSKPDLTGKKVVKSAFNPVESSFNGDAYLGKYKSDLIIKKDGKFIKVGERFVEIENITDTEVTGKYHEELKAGYEEYAILQKDFSFTGKVINKNGPHNMDFTISDGTNDIGQIYIFTQSSNINFNLFSYTPSKDMSFVDSQFTRIFE